jgi:hypothetical protein
MAVPLAILVKYSNVHGKRKTKTTLPTIFFCEQKE